MCDAMPGMHIQCGGKLARSLATPGCILGSPAACNPAFARQTGKLLKPCRLSTRTGNCVPFEVSHPQHVQRCRRRVQTRASLVQQAAASPGLAELSSWLQATPAVQDTSATITAVLGAAALVKAFDVFTQKGWLDQVGSA